MAGFFLVVLLIGAVLAPRYGVDSRPDFCEHPELRNRGD